MDETRRRKLFEDLLREALNDDSVPSAKPRTKPVVPCGCVENCGDVSKHDENTVLEGIVMDPEDRTFEDSVLQDNIQFSRRAKSSNL